MKCKITDEQIKPFMSFGKMPAANGFLEKKDFKSEFFYNMEVGFSEKVSLFQLNKFSNPKIIHNKKYPFYTSSSEYMKTHFKKYADWVLKKYLKSNSKLIEIGSNDGTFLNNFLKTNIDFDFNEGLKIKSFSYLTEGNIAHLEVETQEKKIIKKYLPEHDPKMVFKDNSIKLANSKFNQSLELKGSIKVKDYFNNFKISEI